MTCCFAIIPDGDTAPVAVFESLEDAMEWGVMKYGGNKFSIRHVATAELGEEMTRRSTSGGTAN